MQSRRWCRERPCSWVGRRPSSQRLVVVRRRRGTSSGTLSPRFKQQARLRDLAAISARVLSEVNLSSRRRGAGKTGYRLIPAVRVQQISTRENHRFSPISGLPCATVLRVIGALPGDRLSCPRHQRIIIPTGLASAPRCQDHTISPSHRSVRRPGCDTRLQSNTPVASSSSTLVTIAKRPSSASRDARKGEGDLPDETSDASATNWHDGRLAHAGDAEIARRAAPDGTR